MIYVFGNRYKVPVDSVYIYHRQQTSWQYGYYLPIDSLYHSIMSRSYFFNDTLLEGSEYLTLMTKTPRKEIFY